jgi:hypothetical protein
MRQWATRPEGIAGAMAIGLLLLLGQAAAQTNADATGTSPSEPLPLGLVTDARSATLGGRLACNVRADIHMAAYNPAALDSTLDGMVALEHMDYFAGMSLTTLNHVVQTRGKLTWQWGARFASFGTFDGTDATGMATGTFRGGEYFLQTGVGYALRPHWTLGGQVFAGMRNLDRDNAAVAGLDCAVMGRWPDQGWSVGLAWTGIGYQWGWTPAEGLTPSNLQVGVSKAFLRAPFRLYATGSYLQRGDLAPPGTYDDQVDPLTGEVVENTTFRAGDQVMRHVGLGAEIVLSPQLHISLGFDYRRRKEMEAAGRVGTNGLAIGVHYKARRFELGIGRNTYHFAGSSTHLNLLFPLFSRAAAQVPN